MPHIVTTFLAFIAASWPTLLALGVLTTAINQFTQRVLASRLPRFARVVNTITVDYALLLKELAAFLPKGPPSGGAAVGMVVAILMLCACSLAQVKSAVRTADDIVRGLCLLAHADAVGVSPEQLAKDVCTTEHDLAPFRGVVATARRDGAIKAGLAKP